MNELEAATLQQSMWRVSGSLTQQIQTNGLMRVEIERIAEENGKLKERARNLFYVTVVMSALAILSFALLIHCVLRGPA